MNNIVNRIFACWVAVGVEETEGKVAAGKDGERNLGDGIVRSRCGFGSSQRACNIVGATNAELVIVLGIW